MPRTGPAATISGLLALQLRVLTMRFTREDLQGLGAPHAWLGLSMAWLAGLGRYWDHPAPYLVQRLGLGSLLIVVALSVVVYLCVLPLRPDRWALRHVITFVSLTSLPALIYAIPVERFLSLPQARAANIAFLAVVACWRVLMLGAYLRRQAGLHPALAAVALLLPVVITVTALVALNLERATFELMAGIDREPTPADAAYATLIAVDLWAFLASPAIVILYLIAVYRRRRQRPAAGRGPR